MKIQAIILGGLLGVFTGGVWWYLGLVSALLGALLGIGLMVILLKYFTYDRLTCGIEGAVTLGLVGGAIVPKNYVYPGIFLGLTLGIWLYSGFFYQLLGKMKEKGRYLALPGELLWKPLLAALTVVLSEMAVGPWLALPLALLATNSWGFILAHNQKRPALGAVLTIYGSIMVLWFGIDIAPILPQ